jgi:hypothetical protein
VCGVVVVACGVVVVARGELPACRNPCRPCACDTWQAFRGDAKSHGLLHGHSYTAHPIGCSVAIASLDAYLDPSLNPNLGLPPPILSQASIPKPNPPNPKP